MKNTLSLFLLAAAIIIVRNDLCAGNAPLKQAPEFGAGSYYVKGTDELFIGTWETRHVFDGRCEVRSTTIVDGKNGSYERRTCEENRLMEKGEIHNGHNCGLFAKWDEKGNKIYEDYKRLTIEYDGMREKHIIEQLWSSYLFGPCKKKEAPYTVTWRKDPNDPASITRLCKAKPFRPDMHLDTPIRIKAQGRVGYVAVNIDLETPEAPKASGTFALKPLSYPLYDHKAFLALDPKARRYLMMERETIQQEAAHHFGLHYSKPATPAKRLNISWTLHPDGSVTGYSISTADGREIKEERVPEILEQIAKRLKKPEVDVPIRIAVHHLGRVAMQ